MRGMLVQQSPTDESVSALLAEIAEAAGYLKIGFPSAISPVTKHNVPHAIPDSWMWVKLGDVGRIVGGGTPSTTRPEYFSNKGIPWLTPADLYQLRGKYIRRGKRDLSKLGLEHSSARLLPPGSVLFSSRAPIGYVAIAANRLATNQGFKSCVPFVPAMSNFIYYFMLSVRRDIARKAPGTTFKEVSGKMVASIPFPLPPLSEQERIVSELDGIMQSIEAVETRLRPCRELSVEVASALVNDVAPDAAI